ncbi:hypothetical protein Enr13x_45890 [Stieleria neptunia]|uniref:Uncharacterized protein n=1 Tax=Stieleria neptunia TaxID=2527979 RepID=A0A518HV42_9BACT|nr:hypothetical protein [Stieleria neptunia]QDV44720.1 hypothetical protein Enr13x_45890 [Stieleria neptunia]
MPANPAKRFPTYPSIESFQRTADARQIKMLTETHESPTKQESPDRSEIASQPDDPRRVTAWPMVRILVVARKICGGTFFVVLFIDECFKLGDVSVQLTPYAFWMGLVVAAVAWPLVPFLLKRYREPHFVTADSGSIYFYRRRSDDALDEAGFRITRGFRVLGEPFANRCEIHLGCRQMVIALFRIMDCTRTTELLTITESGRVILTRSDASHEDEPDVDALPSIVVTTIAESPFEEMLAVHLRTATEASEEADSVIVELNENDLVDVLRYANRAHHNMKVKRGAARGLVGPMTYGRFRFPLGIV